MTPVTGNDEYHSWDAVDDMRFRNKTFEYLIPKDDKLNPDVRKKAEEAMVVHCNENDPWY